MDCGLGAYGPALGGISTRDPKLTQQATLNPKPMHGMGLNDKSRV